MLIIGPWNFPVQCVLIPLVNAIAAGCPVVLKVSSIALSLSAHRSADMSQPSELAPAVAALLADLIPRYLDDEAYAVVSGGIEQATKLLEKEWGHSTYLSTLGYLFNMSPCQSLSHVYRLWKSR